MRALLLTRAQLAAIRDIQAAVPGADITFLPLDLASFASVAAAAAQFHGRERALHVLVNNAGIMAPAAYSQTADGYELQFGTNYMGHFLLTRLLLPALERAAAAGAPGAVRIVNISSFAHNMAVCGIDTADLHKQLARANTWVAYGVSKLANIQHARALAKRHPAVLSVSLHPGMVASEIYNDPNSGNMLTRALGPYAKSVAEGSMCQLCCAVGSRVSLADNGEYFVPPGIKGSDGWFFEKASKYGRSDEASDALWEWSEKEVAKHGY